jgi:SEC-C motif domain protein
MNSCPCGSGAEYSNCCEPIITGLQPAKTAESLMRARYSAYAKLQMDFVFETTHPDHREGYDHDSTRKWAETSVWEGLEIISTNKGQEQDNCGNVEFIARYSSDGTRHTHHESAEFKKTDGRWYFTDGLPVKQKPLSVVKTGRNDPCTCGSGSKYKKCCGK